MRFALLVLWLVPALAHAETDAQKCVRAAAQLYEKLEYERALEQLARAKSAASHAPQDDVDIALYEGLVRAELGEHEAADAAFTAALNLDPRCELPVQVPPKVQEAFDRVATQLRATLPPPRSSVRGWAWVPAALTLITTGVGIGAFVAARGTAARLMSTEEPPLTSLETMTLQSRARAEQATGAVMFALAGACLVASVLLFVLGSR